MKNNIIGLTIVIIMTLSNSIAMGKGLIDWEMQVGYNIGATLPSPFPAEIREIKGYTPTFNPSIAGIASINGKESRWGVASGVKLGRKGMTTEARVKSYSTELRGDDGECVKGVWTGDVTTRYNAIGIAVPVLVTYALNNIKIHGGIYGEYLVDRHFGGEVYDGYFRHGDPTGTKAIYDNGIKQEYAFDEEIRRIQCGIDAGIEYFIGEKLTINASATYCLTNIFKKEFTTVTFNMHPMFVNVAVGYRL